MFVPRLTRFNATTNSSRPLNIITNPGSINISVPGYLTLVQPYRHITMAPFLAADDDDPDIDSTNLTLSKLLFAAALYDTSRIKRVC
jgi:hypothetical protein